MDMKWTTSCVTTACTAFGRCALANALNASPEHDTCMHACTAALQQHTQWYAHRGTCRCIWAVPTGALESWVPTGGHTLIQWLHASGRGCLPREVHLIGRSLPSGLFVLDSPQELCPLLEILGPTTDQLHGFDVQQAIDHILQRPSDAHSPCTLAPALMLEVYGAHYVKRSITQTTIAKQARRPWLFPQSWA